MQNIRSMHQFARSQKDPFWANDEPKVNTQHMPGVVIKSYQGKVTHE